MAAAESPGIISGGQVNKRPVKKKEKSLGEAPLIGQGKQRNDFDQ